MLVWVLAMALRPCLCPSVTSRCSVETGGQNSLVFGVGLLLICPTLCFKESQVSTKIRVLSSGTFFLNSGLRNFRHGISIVERAVSLSEKGCRSKHDQLDRRRSTKLTDYSGRASTLDHCSLSQRSSSSVLQHDFVALVS